MRPLHLYKKISYPLLFISITFLTILFPIHIVGLLSNYMPYKIPELIVKKKIKDEHFHSSIKMSLGVILFILFWTIQSIVVIGVFGIEIGLAYLISLPLLAMLNYRLMILSKKIKGMINAVKNAKNADFNKAKEMYVEIKNLV